jgi:hypothetical protein
MGRRLRIGGEGELVDGDLARFSTSQNQVELVGGVATEIRKVRLIGNESANFDKLATRVYPRQLIPVGKLDDQLAVREIGWELS